MKNENQNNKKYTEETQEEILDALINKMEKSGATIDGLKRIIAAIEKRKEQLDEEKHEEDRKRDVDDDKRIKIVRKTISPEVENGVVIAAYTDKNGSLSDSVFFAKGEAISAITMMTAALLSVLDDFGASLDKYIHSLQLISDERKKERK